MIEGLANFRLPNSRKSDAKHTRPSSSANTLKSTSVLSAANGLGYAWFDIVSPSRRFSCCPMKWSGADSPRINLGSGCQSSHSGFLRQTGTRRTPPRATWERRADRSRYTQGETGHPRERRALSPPRPHIGAKVEQILVAADAKVLPVTGS